MVSVFHSSVYSALFSRTSSRKKLTVMCPEILKVATVKKKKGRVRTLTKNTSSTWTTRFFNKLGGRIVDLWEAIRCTVTTDNTNYPKMVHWIYFVKQTTISKPSNKQVLIFDQICLLLFKGLLRPYSVWFCSTNLNESKNKKTHLLKGCVGRGRARNQPITVNTELVVNNKQSI